MQRQFAYKDNVLMARDKALAASHGIESEVAEHHRSHALEASAHAKQHNLHERLREDHRRLMEKLAAVSRLMSEPPASGDVNPAEQTYLGGA